MVLQIGCECLGAMEASRAWASDFVHWYNVEPPQLHPLHEPFERHEGEDQAILAARHTLYLQARKKNPARWSGYTRNWSPVGAATLKPERDCVIKARADCNDIQRRAA